MLLRSAHVVNGAAILALVVWTVRAARTASRRRRADPVRRTGERRPRQPNEDREPDSGDDVSDLAGGERMSPAPVDAKLPLPAPNPLSLSVWLELTKPRLTMLVLVTVAVGYLLAAYQQRAALVEATSLRLLRRACWASVIGVGLSLRVVRPRSTCGVERHHDAQMDRTRDRGRSRPGD
jgi:hypothetical protein